MTPPPPSHINFNNLSLSDLELSLPDVADFVGIYKNSSHNSRTCSPQSMPCMFTSLYSERPIISESDNEKTSNASLLMHGCLESLINDLPDTASLILKQTFEKEMYSFYRLFNRYLNCADVLLDWQKIKPPSPDMIIPYSKISSSPMSPTIKADLNKLAVIKLNGGLGTTMGCIGPKSAITVRDGMNFLDLTVKQLEILNEEYGTSVPLLLMNSFNTDPATKNIIKKFGQDPLVIKTFNQSRFPRIGKESLLPLPSSPLGEKESWYPPGHGDFFSALQNSGMLDSLISDGKEWVFVSNIDNLGATVDISIYDHVVKSGSDYVMELTNKTKADVKGGTLINYEGSARLLEIAQVPTEFKSEFTSIKKFQIFNTNNVWINLRAIKDLLNEGPIDLDIIANKKVLDTSGESIIQLETAIGSAIAKFSKSHGINVPRSRFLPVKNCSDLFLLQSDLYSLSSGKLSLNSEKPFSNIPIVKLGDHFKRVPNFLSRFSGSPKIMELDHLTVTGDVTFGKNVTLIGTVIIVANHGDRIDIPSGTILEDKVVSGNLRILEH